MPPRDDRNRRPHPGGPRRDWRDDRRPGPRPDDRRPDGQRDPRRDDRRPDSRFDSQRDPRRDDRRPDPRFNAPRDPRRDDRRPDPRFNAPRDPRRDDRRDRGDFRRDDRRDPAQFRRDPSRPEPPRPDHLRQQVRAGDPTPFELFCAYYLGIAKDGSYRPANIHTIARQFNRPAGELKQLLQNYGLDAMAVMERDFDLAMAQIDMQLAPEGVNRVELAKPLFEEFLAAPRKKIDWKKIIEEDIRENAKVFGRRD